LRRVLARVVRGVGKVGKAIVGHDRRAARRQARRGE
jgi:hypothetical protein